MAETNQQIWAYLIHLSFNMWADRPQDEGEQPEFYWAQPHLRCEDALWNDIVNRSAAAGINMLVIDLGDGVQYDSHPELAVQGAWSPQRLRDELARIRDQGVEPIPKLNFSTAHDLWMGPYARCVSSPQYYHVCRDLIAETIDLFDGPRLFHLGMDEETAEHQRHYLYAVMRQGDLWWRDLNFLIEQVEKSGARPWVWSDYLWHHEADFLANMPRSVLQSNWYYGEELREEDAGVRAYRLLEEHGYHQVPTGSNHAGQQHNFLRTVAHCHEVVAPPRLLGFFQTAWKPTQESYREDHMAAIEQVARATGRHNAAG